MTWSWLNYNTIMTQLRHNCAKTTPQPHHMLAWVQIFIVQYILIKERRKKTFCIIKWLHKANLNYIVRHKRQWQFAGLHFLIAFLKEATDSNFLISSGTSSQILGARCDNVSDPKWTVLICLKWSVPLFLVV